MATDSGKVFARFAVLVFAAAGIACGQFAERSGPAPSASPVSAAARNLLLADSRSALEVCVDVLPGVSVDADTAVAAVRRALGRIERGPEFARFAGLQVSADRGCPTSPDLTQRQDRHPRAGGSARIPRVTEASRFRSFVFVSPAEEIERVFGGTGLRTATQEAICDPPGCAEVTTALYLSEAELRLDMRLDCLLMKAVGILPPTAMEEC